MSMGNLPESSSRAMLVGTMLVGRLGVCVPEAPLLLTSGASLTSPLARTIPVKHPLDTSDNPSEHTTDKWNSVGKCHWNPLEHATENPRWLLRCRFPISGVQSFAPRLSEAQAIFLLAGSHTPNSHTKNSATKICSKGWVAQALLFW